jgi:hypothetical protein
MFPLNTSRGNPSPFVPILIVSSSSQSFGQIERRDKTSDMFNGGDFSTGVPWSGLLPMPAS